MRIEEKPTLDSLDTNSAETDENQVTKIMASKRHRIALAAGIGGIVVIAGVVAAVAVLMGNSFKKSSQSSNSANGNGSSTEGFDFSDVSNNSSNIRGSPTSMPSTPLQAETSAPVMTTSSTVSPTVSPTASPTISPTLATATPTTNTTSLQPTSTVSPTATPSAAPTMNPTPTTPEPTMMPQSRPIVNPVNYSSETLLTFCVIADVPYYDSEAAALPGQIETQMEGCEFLVHLGDIMRGEIPCDDFQYIQIKEMMLASEVPAFIIPGDNEWNDCGNNVMIDAAWGRWNTYFMNFEDNWNHTIPVVHNLDRPENFYFVKKRTIIFGLNIVGGRVHDTSEWYTRHTALVEWVKAVVLMNYGLYADGVIIMAHARPTVDHTDFFNPLRRFVRDDLGNQVPFLYLHGDGHAFQDERGYLNQPNLSRMQHEGGTRDPILKILADPFYQGNEVHNAFQYDRQL